jgi:hypothetical protein
MIGKYLRIKNVKFLHADFLALKLDSDGDMMVGIINFLFLLPYVCATCLVLQVGEHAKLPAINTCGRMNTHPSEIRRQRCVGSVVQNCYMHEKHKMHFHHEI